MSRRKRVQELQSLLSQGEEETASLYSKVPVMINFKLKTIELEKEGTGMELSQSTLFLSLRLKYNLDFSACLA